MNNLNYKHLSIDVIANRITKHPLLKNINYEDILDYTVDVLRLVNVPRSYEEQSCYKNIVEYKALIPDTALNVKSVDIVISGNAIPMTKSTDTHQAQHERLPNQIDSGRYTYTLNGNMIHTNVKEGIVFVVYDTLKCDTNGLPMIPDNISLIKAIENYIKVQVFTVLVDLQKINQNALHRAEQEYSWYIGKAQTDFQGFENEDSIETFLSNFKRMFDLQRSHKDRFKYDSNRELKYKK